MSYTIYTMPNCDKCVKVKDFLKESGLQVKEVNLGDDEGVVALRSIFPKIKDKVTRTDDGQLPVPLFVKEEGDEIIGVANTVEEVEALVK